MPNTNKMKKVELSIFDKNHTKFITENLMDNNINKCFWYYSYII